MIQIPVTSTGNSSVDVTLDGVTYEVYTTYNSRNTRLYLSLLLNGVPVISGIRLIENYTVLHQYQNSSPDVPQGYMLLATLESIAEQATLGNTGVGLEYTLAYATLNELV